MKKLLIYYLIILLPILGLILVHNKFIFCIALLLYVIIYRPIVDYVRLKSLNINEKFSSFFIPFYIHTKYFKKLYMSISN